jgi:NADPH:quinone reductase-like Zn-dependent oxidoreductase
MAARYVNLAIELGVPKDRIDTIIDFAAAQQYGVKTEGSQEARNSRILAELAGLVAEGKLDVPVAATFPLADIRTAFRQLEQGHTRGKIVLAP